MYIVASFAAFAAVFAACNKEQNAPEPKPADKHIIRVSIPETLTKVSMTDETAGGKGMALAWQENDALRVISGEASELYSIEDGFSGHEATFSGNAVEGTGFTILYPGSFESPDAIKAKTYGAQTQTGNGSTAHLSYNAWLEGVDTYEDIAFTSEWAAAHGGTLSQNGVLKFQVKLPDGVTGVTKASLVAPSALFYKDNAGTVTTNKLSVNLENVDVSASSQVLSVYMNISAKDVSVPSGTTLSVIAVGTDGTEYTKEFTLSKDVVFQGGKLNTIKLSADGEPEIILSDYYVTVNGAGEMTGESWDNAIGTADLRRILSLPATRAAEMDGVTFHMAAGDYYLAEGTEDNYVKVDYAGYGEKAEMTFLGGYPTGLTGTTTAGRDTTQYRTAFTGNNETGILTIGDKVDALFEGLTFKDVSTTTPDYGALRVNGSETAVSLKSCRFVNNVNSDSGKSGASVILDGGALTVENSYFAGNLARNAGALFLISGDDPVSVTNCLFYNNRGINTSGAAQNAGLTDVTFTGCVFDSNKAYDESVNSWGGGAFHTAGSAVTSFVGCTFKDNIAKRCGGAISLEGATVTCTDCTFTGNRADQGDTTLSGQDNTAKTSQVAGGAIILRKAGDVLTLNNCTFIGNSVPNGNGGAIGTQDPAATLTINAGTTFQENTALFHGGAIFSWGGFTIAGTSGSKVTFTDNKTLATGNQHANGGCIWLNEKTTSTISYAVFSGSAAGQPAGTTINYSNGGAISMKGVTSFLADNCEFTGNIGRNGGCLNLELGGSSVCKFTDCNFHDNVLQAGTSGNFHGGAARISYGTAQFEKCVFKNNSAYNGSGVFHLNANKSARIECKDCEFEGNYCGNGRGGCVTIEYGSLYVENCNFKENHAKTDRGGVFYVDSNGVSLEAKNCTFTGNYIDGSSCFGAVMRTQDNCEAIYTDCLFDGNYSTNRGGIFGLNGKTRLKMNRCVVKNNHAVSGGMIQGGADVISYLNRVTFVDNYTTGSGGWGVAFHNGNNNACLNNCTLYGNHCTNSNPGNNISLNSDGGWLIVNSTIVDDNVTALVRANGTRKVTLCNNILINRKTADNMFMLKSAGLLNDLGHNVMSYTAAPASPAIASSSLIGATDASLGGSYSEVWNAADKYGVYSWTNNLTGFSPAAQADVESALKTGYPETDGTHTSITNIGLDFYNWLVEIGEIATDGRGVARTGSWWPGAYQN
jgi:hypothetical protein